MEGMLQILNAVLDWLYFGLISPAFQLLGQGLEFILLKPLAFLHVPVAVQVMLIALLTTMLSMAIRHTLKVDSKNLKFKKEFIAKRKKQQDLRLISDWKSRETLYRSTDRDLDEDFNTHLAYRYSQYVMIYLLPMFLILAWLNTVFSGEKLTMLYGSPYVIPLAGNNSGVEGLSVTFVFLVSYVVSLVIGFQLIKFRGRKVFSPHHSQ